MMLPDDISPPGCFLLNPCTLPFPDDRQAPDICPAEWAHKTVAAHVRAL
ncbi:hypothetical protein [Mixta hanseatica]|uniref:Uncharacterized protein n=1 Tax=Mixta hanseatica TaxID=2872648 RepID=A0ABY4RFU7_9GAMM|nr:hypothetical protein [Mixta hanseatica]UQY45790.1 hypothetical protein K6958_09165 [Mixta hanseatica]